MLSALFCYSVFICYCLSLCDENIAITAGYNTAATGQIIQLKCHLKLTKLYARYPAVTTDQYIVLTFEEAIFSFFFFLEYSPSCKSLSKLSQITHALTIKFTDKCQHYCNHRNYKQIIFTYDNCRKERNQ